MIGLDQRTREIVFGPEVETRGFVYAPMAEDILEGAKNLIRETVARSAHDIGISQTLKDVLSQYLYHHTRRRPMVIPVVTEM
jgi:ribonuclease J